MLEECTGNTETISNMHTVQLKEKDTTGHDWPATIVQLTQVHTKCASIQQTDTTYGCLDTGPVKFLKFCGLQGLNCY